MADGVIPSKDFNQQLLRTVRETIRRERSNISSKGRWHKKKSKTGGQFVIVGTVDDSYCEAGTLDVTVAYASSCSAGIEFGDVINVVDRFDIMGGHNATEFAGLLAMAVRLYNLETCQEEYQLMMLNGHGACPTYG